MSTTKQLFSLAFFFAPALLLAQITVTVTVEGGSVNTTCTDFFGDPDPIFQVMVDDGNWETYLNESGCYNDFPNDQYTASYNCVNDVPTSITMCFRVMENDPSPLNPCEVNGDCLEILCQGFPLPITGSGDYTMTIPAGGGSSGSVDFSITIGGFPNDAPNNEICDAIDLGMLESGVPLGDINAAVHNNYCADWNELGDEPSPCNFGGDWCNTSGVWYSFTTGATEVAGVTIDLNSDPDNTGDVLQSQIAVFQSADNSCNGPWTLVGEAYDDTDFDETLELSCLEPNTTYYFLVDGLGSFANPGLDEGIYGIEINSVITTPAPDLLCDAMDLGTVPLGGSVGLPTVMGNHCATDFDDPNLTGFSSQKSVWFTFQPPWHGHVTIDAVSQAIDPIGLQLALYYSSNDECDGFFFQLDSQWDGSDLDESIEISCLDRNTKYWILVDSDAENGAGVFDLTVSDAGSDVPETDQTVVLCAGESLTVGNINYNMTGVYTDTLTTVGTCISVTNTDLTVLDPLVLDVQVDMPATGLGEPDGEVTINMMGGDGTYTYTWSNGASGNVQTNLLGDQNYCVTVTDGNNCEIVECFVMPFTENIIPTITNGSVACFGEENGVLTFSVVNGIAPYTYTWSGNENPLNGNGAINAEGEIINLNDLPAGTYTINVMDSMASDTTFVGTITQPDLLEAMVDNSTDASCFGECDGAITITAMGGTPPYQYFWASGETTPTITGLCAGDYTVTVQDANNCLAVISQTISEPEAFIATIDVTQNVSCFGQSNGAANVTTSGAQAVSYEWSTGAVMTSVNGLAAGDISVTVTNVDGCIAEATATITEPSEPLGVTIEVTEMIACNGAAEGALRADVTGPGDELAFTWSNGMTTAGIDELPAGMYEVTVSNENNCTATANITIDEPTAIALSFSTENVTCIAGPTSGSINVDEVTGGLEPYLFSLDGEFYMDQTNFADLSAGSYELYLEDAAGCVRTYPFAILPPPDLVVDLGEDQSLILGETLDLRALPSSQDVTYTWEGIDPMTDCANDDCSEISLLPTQSGTYTVMITDTVTFCTAQASVFVEVQRVHKLFFPTAFSPNDDGINDKFIMFGQRGVETVTNFRVFDRYGGVVHEAFDFIPEDNDAGWDGIYRGKLVDSGVYVWYAEVLFIDGETEVFSGDVTVMR